MLVKSHTGLESPSIMSPSGTGPKGYEARSSCRRYPRQSSIILCCLVQNTDLVISRDDLVFERAGKFGNDQWPKKSSEKFLQVPISKKVPV
jgi:hypothetical protein